MASSFSYSTTYVLDKGHFSETFDESITTDNAKTAYLKAIILAAFGLIILMFTDISPFGAWFIVGLGVLEALSIRFKKSWWLARQMISKAANTEMTLTITDDGISSKSFYVESQITWAEITKIEKTSQGWLLHHDFIKTYLSDRCLSDVAKEFISEQVSAKL